MVPQAAEIGDGRSAWPRRAWCWRPGSRSPWPGRSTARRRGFAARRRSRWSQKTRAEENFRDAQQAVEDYLIRVSDETLLQQQDSDEFRQLRKNLLEDALKYYQRFLARQGNDPKLLVDLAHAHSSIAGIIGEIGSTIESIERVSTSALDLREDRPREPDRFPGPQ